MAPGALSLRGKHRRSKRTAPERWECKPVRVDGMFPEEEHDSAKSPAAKREQAQFPKPDWSSTSGRIVTTGRRGCQEIQIQVAMGLIFRHTGVSRCPVFWSEQTWIPAYAGMTDPSFESLKLDFCRRSSAVSSHSISSYKSRHCGLVFSINSIFHLRFHSFIAFSRAIALSIFGHSSYQTSM
jgi:hypothetical protein